MAHKDLEKARRARNPEKHRAYMREYERKWRATNPEKLRARKRKWYAMNSEKVLSSTAGRRKLIPRERVIEDYLKIQVETRGGLCIKFIDPGQRGAPDRLVVLPNAPTYYVELKRPKLGKVGAHQERYHERLRERGQRVWVLWSKEDVDAFMAEVEFT